MYLPWIFYDLHSTPLGHGAYDLSVLDEKLFDNKVKRENIETVIYEMQKSEYWIPAFPNDGRTSNGIFIVGVLLIWLAVFLILGLTHQVISLTSSLVTACVLVLAYVAAKGAYYWAHNPIGDEYLMKREKAFIDVAEKFNAEHPENEFKIEIGRYAAHIALRFSVPVKKLGSLLMQYQRVYKKKKDEEKAKIEQGDDLL